MNWFSLGFAVLLLTMKQSASSNLAKSPWADPDKASSFMNCLITNIVDSENFPQEEKEDLKSIMDTFMSAISEVNARGKSSGPQMQAINMAIASSLAEIVVAADADNPTTIAAKTQDLSEGLEECFISVMGTIDSKFIGEINDLITMFAKEAVPEIQEPQDQEDPSTEKASQSAVQLTPNDDGDQDPKSTPNNDGDQDPKSAPSDVEPQVSESESISVEPQASQTLPELATGTANELANTTSSRVVQKIDVPQQIVRTEVSSNRSPSSSFSSASQSVGNTYQSSQTSQGSSERARGYGRRNRRPDIFEPAAIAAASQVTKPAKNNIGSQISQDAPGSISRDVNKLADISTRRKFQRKGVPQQTVSVLAYPNRSSSSSIEATNQSADKTYQSGQPIQESSQIVGGHGGRYFGPRISKPTSIDAGSQSLQAVSGINSRVVKEKEDTSTRIVINELGDTSTRRGFLRSGLTQQTMPTEVYPKRTSSSSFTTTSQSAANSHQSSQTFQATSQMARGYGSRNRRPEFFKPPSPSAGPQALNLRPNDVGPHVSRAATGFISREANKLEDTSTRREFLRNYDPLQTVTTAIHPETQSSSSFRGSQSSDNTYQSSQTFQDTKARGYGSRNSRPVFSKPPVTAAGPKTSRPAQNKNQPQVSQRAPGLITRVADESVDTSARAAVRRNGVAQQSVPIPAYPNRSSFQSSHSAGKTYQSSQTSHGSSQANGEYRGIYRRPELLETMAIDGVSQSSHATTGPISRVVNRQRDISTRRMVKNQGDKATRKIDNEQGNTLTRRVVNKQGDTSTRRADNEQGDTSTRRTALRSSVPQQTFQTAVYPKRSSSASFQTASQLVDNTYQSIQTIQGSSQTTGGFGRAYSRSQASQPNSAQPQISQPERIGVGPQIPQAGLGLASSPDSQGTFNEKSCNDQLPELSVLTTLNSPIGLRNGSAAVRIKQMISSILNAVSPRGIDVLAFARSLQKGVSNLRSLGMSSSDAKLEVMLELIVGLLQIVSNSQITEIKTTTASSVTNAAARCFELALA